MPKNTKLQDVATLEVFVLNNLHSNVCLMLSFILLLASVFQTSFALNVRFLPLFRGLQSL